MYLKILISAFSKELYIATSVLMKGAVWNAAVAAHLNGHSTPLAPVRLPGLVLSDRCALLPLGISDWGPCSCHTEETK